MSKNQHSATPLVGPFNTLAQSETGNLQKSGLIVKGKGSDLINTKALKGRAKRKLITQKMMLSLIDVSDKDRAPDRKKSYWNTYHCQNKVHTANGRLYGKFCKNRFCTLCCSIRKAVIINKYLPAVQTWEEPHFVTLTIKAIRSPRLKTLIDKTLEGFQIIKDKYRKRNVRGTGIRLIGIKSLECNFNPKTQTYNPHLHLIVANKEIAETLKKEWLTLWKENWTYKGAQKIRKVKDTERDLIEIVKYGSKIFTEPDLHKKTKTKGQSKIYVAALDNIFAAMRRMRIFERFGFNLPKDKRINSAATFVQYFDEWEFCSKSFDWINSKSGKSLSEYRPSPELVYLLDNNIDTSLK